MLPHLCYLPSCVRLFATPWTVAHWAPLSMEFSRQEYWSQLPCPQGIFPTQGWGLPRCRQILYGLSRQGSPSLFATVLLLKLAQEWSHDLVSATEMGREVSEGSRKRCFLAYLRALLDGRTFSFWVEWSLNVRLTGVQPFCHQQGSQPLEEMTQRGKVETPHSGNMISHRVHVPRSLHCVPHPQLHEAVSPLYGPGHCELGFNQTCGP